MSTIDLTGEHFIQSPYTYMQAAGSDGSDHTVKGFHLRWDFKKLLQEQHLPKGNLAAPDQPYEASYGFNREDDFVKVHRVLFTRRYYTAVDLRSAPTTIIHASTLREWRYSDITPSDLTGGQKSKVVLTFPDAAYYDSLKLSYDPESDPEGFLKNYTGVIHARLDNKLCFRVEWDLGEADPSALGSAAFRYETISLTDTGDADSEFISCRNDVDGPKSTTPVIETCEDIQYVRFDRVNVYPIKMRFYGYQDYIDGVNQEDGWTGLGEYSLTDLEAEAFDRLERPTAFTIHNKWPKFNEVDLGTGAFTVSVPNYEDRWTDPDGLLFGVEKYLELSQDAANYRAEEVMDADPIGGVVDDSKTEVSYLDLLNMVSIDFHVARMLGLGYIDAMPEIEESDEYIYLMEYITEADLEDGDGARTVKHLYMTPQIKSTDFKLPQKPTISTIDYGLLLENGTPKPTSLTDENGYAKYADIRFVNIHRADMDYEREMETFFEVRNEFCLCSQSLPIAFGLEYAVSGQPYVKPELNHSSDYTDSAGIGETIMIPNGEQNPVYRHQETEEGVHCYALYSINWFSRASDRSPDQCTNLTQFTKRNTILPPANLAVQLIQPETPLILTTAQEQSDYDAIIGDKTYLRATFDWNYIHHKAYQFANKAEFFFNKTEKEIVQGKIVSVTSLSDHRVEITTSSYDNIAVSPIETIQPLITPGTESIFVGSLFTSEGRNYRVESVTTTGAGENPTFILHEVKETHSMEDPVGSNIWMTTETFVSPEADKRFLVTENLNDGANWDNRLQRVVYLEKFGRNDQVSISGSSFNNGEFVVVSASLAGSDTEIVVKEDLTDTVVDGSLNYEVDFPIIGFNGAETGFLIAGDVTALLSGATVFRIEGSTENDGNHNVSSYVFNGTETEIIPVGPFETNSWVGKLFVPRNEVVTAYNAGTSTITVGTDLTTWIQPTRTEERTNEDGSITEFTVGGFTGTCAITEQLDVYNDDNVEMGHSPGDEIAISRTGIYELAFVGNPLPSHIDPDVNWFRGKVRILEDASFLPTPLGRDTALMKELDVWNVGEDDFGNLVLSVVDPTFEVDPSSIPTAYTLTGEYVPIITGASVEINYHPSYFLYLSVDENTVDGTSNEFNETSIIPDLDEGSRKTFLGIRGVDGVNSVSSHVGTPSAVIAEEIREPMAPNPPSGPLYATRPDFYGKSTYTVDVSFTNVPYSVLVYRANERLILNALYTKEKIQEILDDLGAITAPDLSFTDRWNDFVNVNTVLTAGADFELFDTHGPSTFRFPIPNNPDYVIPQTVGTDTPIYPFNGVDRPGSETITFDVPGNPIMKMKQVVKEAISGAFISQTESPIIFDHLKSGEQTSTQPPRLRDDNDDLIAPSSGNALYDPTPYAVKLPSGDMRFTDYKLDGGSDSFYFYYAMELSAKQKKSPASGIVGPIQLINTRPAKAPFIKKATVQLADVSTETVAGIRFKIEPYIQSENISKVAIYRATNDVDALSVRTMDLAATIPLVYDGMGVDITVYVDEFTTEPFPLYGEHLHYRLVAYRDVMLEDGVTIESIPSEPSRIERIRLVDNVNPPAPLLQSKNTLATAEEMQEVTISWEATCYNGTYVLDKLSPDGNWTEIYRTEQKVGNMQYPPLVSGIPDFVGHDLTALLPRVDSDGEKVTHSFRVRVINASGLLNLSQKPLTLDQGCADLLVLEGLVDFADGNTFSVADLENIEVDEGPKNPVSMTFGDQTSSVVLPAGHNSITAMRVAVHDNFENRVVKSLSLGGTVTFNDGDFDNPGESLELNTVNENQNYTITVSIKTDTCSDAQDFHYSVAYVSGPCNDLSKLTEIISLTDGNATAIPTLEIDGVEEIDDGVPYPTSFTFQDVMGAAFTATGQTFDRIEVSVKDGVGNVASKDITTLGGSITFLDGDFDNPDFPLVLADAAITRSFDITATVFTSECVDGASFEFTAFYTFDTCAAVALLGEPVSFSDNVGNTFNPISNQEITAGTAYPGEITITDIIGASLPVEHTYQRTEVTVMDTQGGFLNSEITTVGGSLVINNGDGGLVLDVSSPNNAYTIIIQVFTDLCQSGEQQVFTINYNV